LNPGRSAGGVTERRAGLYHRRRCDRSDAAAAPQHRERGRQPPSQCRVGRV